MLVSLLLVGLVSALVDQQSFSESISLRPTLDGSLVVHAVFTVLWHRDAAAVASRSYDLVSAPLGRLVDDLNVSSLRLSLGAGRYYVERWGVAPFAAPAGLLIDARCGDDAWERLLQGLGGLLGVSVAPLRDASAVGRDGVRTAAAPREALCTENLTPWLGLLPGRDRSGLGALFAAPVRVLSSGHHALGVSVAALGDGQLRFAFELVMVAAPARTWTARSVFGVAGLTACPLASSSVAMVDYALRPDAHGTNPGRHELSSAAWDFRITAAGASPGAWRGVNAVRFLTGWGLESGGVRTVLTSASVRVAVDVVELVPWFLRVDASSVRLNGAPPGDGLVSLEAAIERKAPSVLRLRGVVVGPNGTAELTYAFVKLFLHLSEHPPDAHHGHVLPAARVDFGGDVVFTDVLVAQLATPDFSMPFNVVTMSGVVLGFFFGSVLAVVTARYSRLKRGEQLQSSRPLARLLRGVLALVDRYA